MTPSEIEQWHQEWLDYKHLMSREIACGIGLRMGQHFCNHFNLTNPDLYYEVNPVICWEKIWSLVGN